MLKKVRGVGMAGASIKFDLNLHLYVCRLNYTTLCHLLHKTEAAQLPRLLCADTPNVEIAIKPRQKWTQMLHIRQTARLHRDYQPLHLKVSIYHDFHLAEIHRFQGQHPPMPGTRHPAGLYTGSEKIAQNLFLHHWLRQLVPLATAAITPELS